MYFKSFGIWVLGFLLSQLIYIASAEAPLFSGIHILCSFFGLVISFMISYGIILPIFIESELEKNIKAVFGDYRIIDRWGNLTITIGRDGELLLLSEDAKLYKVKIKKLKIVEKLQVQIGFDL